MSAVKETINQILTSKLGIAPTEITDNASFTKDLGIDSLDYAELVMEFEQAFNIRIPDNEAEKLQTLQQATDYITAKLG